jgi:hypothetical protein
VDAGFRPDRINDAEQSIYVPEIPPVPLIYSRSSTAFPVHLFQTLAA